MDDSDPRAQRSRAALRAAVLELAASQPVDDLTVAAICRRAEVTRDTFYRHATSPAALLADALAAEIDAIGPRERLDESERDLWEHVRGRAAVYRGAMNPSLSSTVRARIEQAFRHALAEWLDEHPGALPDALRHEPGGRDLAVAYAAGGTVAAIEHWLRSGDDDIDSAARSVLAASPEWWLRSRGPVERRKP